MNQQLSPFELILDDCVTAVLQKDHSTTTCLQQYPNHRDALEPLLHLTLRLQKAQLTVQPDPEFMHVAALRMQNMILARPRQPQIAPKEIQPSVTVWQKVAVFFAPQRPFAWARVIGIVLFICLSLSTMTVFAASDALPGQRLYPVKQIVESAQLSLTFAEAQKAELHLTLAGRRLAETAALLNNHQTTEIANSLAAYQTEIETAVAYLGAASELSTQEKESLARVIATSLADDETRLRTWQAELPTSQDVFAQALQASRNVQAMAFALLADVQSELPLIPRATVTPTPFPSSTPEPVTPTTVWQLPPFWPPECPSPLEWPDEWPTECTIPGDWPLAWPEPPGGWPTPPLPTGTAEPTARWTPPLYWPPECPVPQKWPFSWPEGCVLPTSYPPDWTPPPDGWPDLATPLPIPTVVVPPNWPAECPLPPERLEDWDGWPEDCQIPPDFEWPDEWPEMPPPDDWVNSPDQLPPLPTGFPEWPDEWPTPPSSGGVPPSWPWP